MAAVRGALFLSLIILYFLVTHAAFAPKPPIALRDDDLALGRLLDRIQLAENNDALAAEEKKYISAFEDVSDSEKYGYVTMISDVEITPDRQSLWNLAGARDNRGRNVQWVNFADCVVNGKKYKATEGFFETEIEPHAGIIIAKSGLSPTKSATQNDVDPRDIVPLNKWSDVVYLQWLDQAKKAGVSPQNIKIIARATIINHQTENVFHSVMVRRLGVGNALPDWNARITLHADNPSERDDFLTLLQTPNGAGCAFFLAGHKATLGAKRIVSVTMWTGPDEVGALPEGDETESDEAEQDEDGKIKNPATLQLFREIYENEIYPNYVELRRQAVRLLGLQTHFQNPYELWLDKMLNADPGLMPDGHTHWFDPMIEQADTQYARLNEAFSGYQGILHDMKEFMIAWRDIMTYGYTPNLYFTVEDVP